MSATGVLSEAWAMYGAHWRHLMRLSFSATAGAAVAGILLTAALGATGAVLALALSLLVSFWLQAALVVAVADVRDGRAALGLRATFARAWPRVAAVSGAAIVQLVAVAAGLALLIVPGLVLLTWWAVVVPLIVLDGAGIVAAFRRSRQLVRGCAWSVFGVVLAVVAVEVAGLVAVWAAGGPLVELAVGSVIAPYSALVTTLLYFRLRDESPARTELP